MKFTEDSVRQATCPAGRKDVMLFDDTLPGFGLRVTAGGRRIFILQYRNGPKIRRATIGAWGEVTVAAARRKAEILRGDVRDRRDPVAERAAKQAATLAAETLAKAAAARVSLTVDALISDWTDNHLVARSISYRSRVPRELRGALSAFLTTPAANLDRAAAVKVLDSVKATSGPVAANRLRAEARACWTWACARGALTDNPWSATPRPLARETSRERVLADSEVGALYAEAGNLTEPWGVLVRLLILTGQRRTEIAGMRWAELDAGRTLLSLPGARTKNGHPHAIPLPAEATGLLLKVSRRTGAEFVFEGPRETAVSGFGKVKARLDAALVRAKAKDSGALVPWVLHDLRRTMATGLQRLGVRLEVTEAVLNHVSGSRAGIVGVYQRHGWAAEKRAAIDLWATYVERQAAAYVAQQTERATQ